jgi:hypothetical protein
MWDFVMDKSGTGAGFLRELRFPLPIYIPSASPQSSYLSPEAGTKGPEVAAVPIASQTGIKKKNATKIDLNLFPFFFTFYSVIQFTLQI